jgi:hypothetical protein
MARPIFPRGEQIDLRADALLRVLAFSSEAQIGAAGGSARGAAVDRAAMRWQPLLTKTREARRRLAPQTWVSVAIGGFAKSSPPRKRPDVNVLQHRYRSPHNHRPILFTRFTSKRLGRPVVQRVSPYWGSGSNGTERAVSPATKSVPTSHAIWLRLVDRRALRQDHPRLLGPRVEVCRRL